MNFRDTHDRLVEQLRNRVRNGELTERALARQLGISQPHVNNVLRGRRKLSPEIADLILKFFHSSVLDLYADGELHKNLRSRIPADRLGIAAAVLKQRLGPGNPWLGTTDGRSRYHLPARVNAIPGCTVFGRLAPDYSMPARLCGSDIALLDTSIAGRLADHPSELFVLERSGDTLLRWIRGGFGNLYIVDEQNLNLPLAWEPLPMREEQRLDFIKARVLWLGAEASLYRG